MAYLEKLVMWCFRVCQGKIGPLIIFACIAPERVLKELVRFDMGVRETPGILIVLALTRGFGVNRAVPKRRDPDDDSLRHKHVLTQPV